jgi:hypothetical protein
LLVRAVWVNDGVAPMYHRRPVRYRLAGPGGTQTIVSIADTREWLPGVHIVEDMITTDVSLPPGVYSLEVAIESNPGVDPATVALPSVRLANQGQQSDGWLLLSEVTLE